VAAVALLTAGGLLLAALVLASLAAVVVDPAHRPSLAPTPLAAALAVAGGVLLQLVAPTRRPTCLSPNVAAVTVGATAGLVAVLLLIARATGIALGAGGSGPFEVSLLVAAVAVVLAAPLLAILLRRRAVLPWLGRRGELLLLAGIIGLFMLVVGRMIATGTLLGFDESIYALTARSWLEGTPATGWSSHRSPGISILGLVPLLLGGGDAALRWIGLLFGVALLLVAWRLGRRIGGPAAGALAALAIAAIPDLQLNAAFFLTDVAGTALVLLLVLLAWDRLEERTEEGSVLSVRSLLPLAPVAAAAFYLRYGSSVPILFVTLTVLLVWPRRLVVGWRAVLAAAGLLLLLLVPHLAAATIWGGFPWAIALSARDLASPAYPGEALNTYLRGFLSVVAGPVAGPVAIAGVLALGWRLAIGPRRDPTTRGYLLLIVPALAVGLLLGVVALAQTRYVFVPLALLVTAGAIAVVRVWRRIEGPLRPVLATLAVAVGVSAMLNAGGGRIALLAADAPGQQYLAEAGRRIRADASASGSDATPDCAILGYPVPQITWYSSCAAYDFGFPPAAGREKLLTAAHRYLLLLAGDRPRQPQGELLDRYLALVEPEPFAEVRNASGGIGARIYRFVAPP
jgi:hypothetical protein